MIKAVSVIVVNLLFSVAYSAEPLTVIIGDMKLSKFVHLSSEEIFRKKGKMPSHDERDKSYDVYIIDSLGNTAMGTIYMPQKRLCFDYNECQDIPKIWPDIDSLFACCGKEIAIAKRIPPKINFPKAAFWGTFFDDTPLDDRVLYIYILDKKDEAFFNLLKNKGAEVCRKDCLKKKCRGVSCPKDKVLPQKYP